MTCKERWLAALKRKPADRLPFWPKLSNAYSRAQLLPHRAMTVPALHAWIGSDPHVWIAAGIREKRTNTSLEIIRDTPQSTRTLFHTPAGTLTAASVFDEASQAWHPTEFPVKTAEDISRMILFYRDISVELDPEIMTAARRQYEEVGPGAVTASTIGESPFMHWLEFLAGIENGHFLLADCTDEVEELFDAMHRVLLRKATLLAAEHPADVFYMMENTSTTLLSPNQYRRYCFPFLCTYAEILSDAGRPMILHMCGHLKDLLPDLARVPAIAFEAFTSPPVGNTTLADGRKLCPHHALIGGTNAVLWTRPAAEIEATLQRDLDALPHHRGIVLSSAGVMPPLCPPETIKRIAEWVHRYPARFCE